VADYGALRDVWPEHGSLEEKLAAVNSMEVAGPTVDIPADAVRQRLLSRMLHLECFALAATTRSIRLRLNMPGVPRSVTSAVYLLQLLSSDERVFGKHRLSLLRSLFSDLVSDEASGITQKDADDVLALSQSTVSWWQRHGFSQPVGIYDAIEARLS